MTRIAALLALLHLLAPVTDGATTRTAGSKGTAAGVASWYAYRQGEAAAGPALRRMLGPSWRGKTVTVRANGRSVRVVLSDWCSCWVDHKARLIDLNADEYARLAPLSTGLLRVEVVR